MAKRKSQTSSEDEERAPKKSKSSLNQSYIQTANLMAKTKLLHKGLNLSTNAIMSKIKIENSSGSDSEIETPQTKSKTKVKNKINYSEIDSERQSTINSLLNETKMSILTNSKSKKSQNRKSLEKVKESFTPKLVPIIKSEPINESSSDSNGSSSDSEIKFKNIDNAVKNNDIDEETQVNSFNNNDTLMMKSIENKISVLQDIRISPLKSRTPKQQLNDVYPNYKLAGLSTKLKIKESDDVFLFRVPKSVDPQLLLNVQINIEEKCKINIEGGKFILRPTSKIPEPTLVLSEKTDVLNFKSNIVMEKYVKANKEPKIPAVEKSSVPLPSNLKSRHPLFGYNFEDKIQLDEVTEKKLDDAIKNLLKPIKKKKAKKEPVSMVNSTLLPDASTSLFNLNLSLITPQRKKKKKEKKLIGDEEIIADIFNTNEEQKVKEIKIKKEIISNLSTELFGPENEERKTKKRKIKEEPTDVVSPKKKKKKRDTSVYE